MRVDANEQSQLHFAKILVQMDPRDTHPLEDSFNDREPDIILTFDEFSFERNQETMEELKRGDLIRFNATISHLGVRRGKDHHADLTKYHNNDEESTHHMHAKGVKKIGHND